MNKERIAMRRKLHMRHSKLTSLGLMLVFFGVGSSVVFGGSGSLLLMPTVSEGAVETDETMVASAVDVEAETPEVSIAPSIPAPVLSEPAPTPEPEWQMITSKSIPAAPILAASGLVIDDKTGEVLATKNADAVVPMASITKLMTAWVALDRADMDYKIKVSARAAATPPTHLPLREGDVLTVEELIHAILLTSANDAAHALEDGLGGRKKFVAAMNTKAKEIGLEKTSFANPTGFDAPGHHSTSAELAIMAHHMFKEHPELYKILQKKDAAYAENKDRKAYYMPNFHPLVGEYAGFKGGKPGYTGNAGFCLLTVAERKGMRVIAVALNSPDVNNDSVQLLNMGFDEIKKR